MTEVRTESKIARGELLLRLAEADGRVVEETLQRNSFTSTYAAFWAKALAGTGTVPLALTHIGLGAAGVQIADCESIAGWAAAPTLDSATYRQGTSSLQFMSAASTSTIYANSALIAASNISATGTSVEFQMRLLSRANVDLANSALRIYSGADVYFTISLAAIEAATGPFADAAWKLVRLPITAFSVGAGAPVWTGVTGVGVVCAANASGTATINLDDVRSFPLTIDTSAAAISVPNERVKAPLLTLEDLGSAQVRARVFWLTAQVVGTYYVAGLYGNAGNTLAAIVPITLSKLPTLSLTAEWTITALGG